MVLVRKGQGKEILLMEPSLFKFHRYLFVLTHARSYSTLLCHVLGSHPRISGYTESMLVYDTAVELIRLNAAALEAGNYQHDCEYVLDKLIYDDFTISDEVLGNPRLTPIFLVRPPVPSIVSLARMRVREHETKIALWKEGTNRQAAVRRAATYYAERLDTLRGLCVRVEALGGRGLLLLAERLLDDTAGSFRFLERELNLDPALHEEYTVFAKTGAVGSGDTSAMIRTGRIVRPHSEEGPSPEGFAVPDDLLKRAEDAYSRCVEHLMASPALKRFGGEPAQTAQTARE